MRLWWVVTNSMLRCLVCRALGIPSRPVTNFVSAHETNHSLSIDKYFDVFGEEIKGGPDGNGHDAIWNFHSWTEVLMARTDLPHGYGGWQCIDATPKQQSGNSTGNKSAIITLRIELLNWFIFSLRGDVDVIQQTRTFAVRSPSKLSDAVRLVLLSTPLTSSLKSTPKSATSKKMTPLTGDSGKLRSTTTGQSISF